MSRVPVLRKTLRDQRWIAVGVGFAGFLIGLLDVFIYPQYRDQLKDFQYPDAFKGFVGEAGSIATPEGFITAEFFSWIPLLLITIAIIGGTGALAGEEGTGTLDLLLAQPIARRRLLLEKAAGLVASVTLAALICFPAFLIGKAFVDFDLGAGRLFATTLNMLPIAYLFLALALWGSAALPSRGAAAMLAIVVVVAAYFLYTVGAAVDSFEQPRKISPFYWADPSHVVVHGFDWARSGLLLGVAAVFLALAAWSFERRDITAGGREWSLASVWSRVRPRPERTEQANA